MKTSIKAVLFAILAFGIAGAALAFDSDPTPKCRPDGTACIPPAH